MTLTALKQDDDTPLYKFPPIPASLEYPPGTPVVTLQMNQVFTPDFVNAFDALCTVPLKPAASLLLVIAKGLLTHVREQFLAKQAKVFEEYGVLDESGALVIPEEHADAILARHYVLGANVLELPRLSLSDFEAGAYLPPIVMEHLKPLLEVSNAAPDPD